MAVPTYRCPFKVDTTNDQGITCESTNCAAYDGDAEHCSMVEFVQRQLLTHGKIDPNNA